MRNWAKAAALDPVRLRSDPRGGRRSARNHPPPRKEWGDAQVRRYITRLEQGIARLTAGREPFKDMIALYPALGVAHWRHHYVFCLLREHAPALVVAILHERMNLLARLADRPHEADRRLRN